MISFKFKTCVQIEKNRWMSINLFVQSADLTKEFYFMLVMKQYKLQLYDYYYYDFRELLPGRRSGKNKTERSPQNAPKN